MNNSSIFQNNILFIILSILISLILVPIITKSGILEFDNKNSIKKIS